jgi:hypothetical protein
MALGKHGNGIHAAKLQRLLKLVFFKPAAHAGDPVTGVKVQMYLSETHRNPSCFSFLPASYHKKLLYDKFFPKSFTKCLSAVKIVANATNRRNPL